MRRKIVFSRPVNTASVSVTGKSCGLNCAHCGAKYLSGMRPPEEVLAALPDSSTKSVLISGGCDEYGRVPLGSWPEKFKAAYPDIRLNCHVGVADSGALERLSDLVQVISFDYVSDPAVIGGVYGSSSTPADYLGSFVAASNAVPTAPHITVGLLGPDAEPELSERSLLEIRSLADRGIIPEPPAVVVIAFIPTRGTRMQDVPPPEVGSVIRVISRAKELFPASPVCLGCMRPAGRYREQLDSLAVEASADVIVMPSSSARRKAAEMGLDVILSDECCVFPALDCIGAANG